MATKHTVVDYIYYQKGAKLIGLMIYRCRTHTFYMMVLYIILKFKLIICQIKTDVVLSKNVKITESIPAVITLLQNLTNKSM